MIDRPYRKDDPRGWLPWRPKRPLPPVPMHKEPEHISYPLATVLRELLKKQPDEFGNPVSTL